MRFNINCWTEFKPNEKLEAKTSEVHVMLSEPASVFVTSEGVETLVGYGTEVKVQITEQVNVIVYSSSDTLRCFLKSPSDTSRKAGGQVKFTNADRMPLESGSVREVRGVMRELQLREREMRAQFAHERSSLRREANELRKSRKRHKEAEPDPEPQPEPELPEDASGPSE